MQPDLLIMMNHIKVKLLIGITLLVVPVSCVPSPVVWSRYVVNNFHDEGFLSSDMVQVIGKEDLTPEQTDSVSGQDALRRLCLNHATVTARKRMLTIFLHTYFDIAPMQGRSASYDHPQFDRDYPEKFTPRDILRAEVDFSSLMGKSYIALQDVRTLGTCTVVLRIQQEDIPKRIRAVTLSFRPENLTCKLLSPCRYY